MSKKFDSLSAINREQRSRVHDLCRLFNRSPSKSNLKKLQQIFAQAGENLIIEEGFYCDYGNKISFGNRVYLNVNCTLLDGGNIRIGDDVLIGPNVQILTVNHPKLAAHRLQKTALVEDVVIGNNVWIGAGVIIVPGVTIADEVIVAAGSVVTKNLESNCLFAGNPAIKVE